MKLDKIYKTWKTLPALYEAKGKVKGMPKKDFLLSMVESDAVSRLRSVIESDFVETKENRDKYDKLFDAITRVQKLLPVTDEIDDLNDFVWNRPDETQLPSDVIAVNLMDFEILKEKSFCDENDLMCQGFCDSVYVLKNGKIESYQLNPDSEHLICFNTQESMLAWLFRNASEVSNKNSFIDKVYAFTVNAIVKQTLEYPTAFTDSDQIDITDEEDFTFDQKFKTVLDGQFYCAFSGTKGVLKNDTIKSVVVTFD